MKITPDQRKLLSFKRNLLAAARERAGLSQTPVAARMRAPLAGVAHIEAGIVTHSRGAANRQLSGVQRPWRQRIREGSS